MAGNWYSPGRLCFAITLSLQGWATTRAYVYGNWSQNCTPWHTLFSLPICNTILIDFVSTRSLRARLCVKILWVESRVYQEESAQSSMERRFSIDIWWLPTCIHKTHEKKGFRFAASCFGGRAQEHEQTEIAAEFQNAHFSMKRPCSKQKWTSTILNWMFQFTGIYVYVYIYMYMYVMLGISSWILKFVDNSQIIVWIIDWLGLKAFTRCISICTLVNYRMGPPS